MEKLDSITEQVTKFYEAAYIDLPLAAAKSWFGRNRSSIRKAGWAIYDSFIALANEAANQLYRNRFFADAFGRTLETSFAIQHIFDGLTLKIADKSQAEPLMNSDGDTVVVAEIVAADEGLGSVRGATITDAAIAYRTAARSRRSHRAAA